MQLELLVSLAKAGGIAALAIGVLYLLYREVIKLGVFPKLSQSQGFALLCLVTLLIFAVVMTTLLRTQNDGQAPNIQRPDAVPPVPTKQPDSGLPAETPQGLTKADVIDKAKASDRAAWEKAEKQNSLKGYAEYLAHFPRGEFAARATSFTESLQSRMPDTEGYRGSVRKTAESAEAAKKRIVAEEFKQKKASSAIQVTSKECRYFSAGPEVIGMKVKLVGTASMPSGAKLYLMPDEGNLAAIVRGRGEPFRYQCPQWTLETSKVPSIPPECVREGSQPSSSSWEFEVNHSFHESLLSQFLSKPGIYMSVSVPYQTVDGYNFGGALTSQTIMMQCQRQ
jgi:hypothetical protein